MMSKTLVFVLAAFVVLACGTEDIQELGDNDDAAKSMATPEADDELGEGVGGRGASLSTTGSFTLSSGMNSMGGEEDDELGEGGAFLNKKAFLQKAVPQVKNKKAMKAMNNNDFLQKAVPQVEALLKQGSQSTKLHELLDCTAVNEKLSENFKAWRKGPFEATEHKGPMTFQFLKKVKVISNKRRLGASTGFRRRRPRSARGAHAGSNKERRFKAHKERRFKARAKNGMEKADNKGAKKASTEQHALYKTMLCLTRKMMQRKAETECCVSKSIVTQPEQKEAVLSEIERKKYTTDLKLW